MPEIPPDVLDAINKAQQSRQAALDARQGYQAAKDNTVLVSKQASRMNEDAVAQEQQAATGVAETSKVALDDNAAAIQKLSNLLKLDPAQLQARLAGNRPQEPAPETPLGPSEFQPKEPPQEQPQEAQEGQERPQGVPLEEDAQPSFSQQAGRLQQTKK